MLGIPDPWVWLAYLLSLLSAVICVAWGVYRWNWEDPADEPPEEIKQWTDEEKKVEKEF